jgi:protein SCO1/2
MIFLCKKIYFLLLAALLWPPFVSASENAEVFPDASIFNLDSTWIDSSGKDFALSQLKGHGFLLAMVYTSCQFSCPLIIQEMDKVRKKLPKDLAATTRSVLVSMDPARDTPDTLKKFALKRKLDPKFWTLLTAKNELSVRELSSVLGVNYKKIGDDFAHSNLIVVIDHAGVIVFSKANLNHQVNETAEALKKASSTAKK